MDCLKKQKQMQDIHKPSTAAKEAVFVESVGMPLETPIVKGKTWFVVPVNLINKNCIVNTFTAYLLFID